jgi:hypothetical protein
VSPLPWESYIPEAAVSERDATVKLRIYHTMYRLSRSFANIVAHCRVLQDTGILTRKYAHLYASSAQELQAEINEDIANALSSIEGDDSARFGKVRQAWEKELRDPNDVFIHAEERRKEIARQGGTMPLLARKKTLKSTPPRKGTRTHKARAGRDKKAV